MDAALSVTTTVFLEGLLDPNNEQIWLAFDGRYRPIIIAVARRLGLRPDDAEDVAQQTLLLVVRDYRAGRYVRGRGRLRSWILAIARHRIADVRRQQCKDGPLRGDSALGSIPDDHDLESIWDAEQERAILELAMTELQQSSKVEPRTLRAFELVARGGATPEFVAAECGMTVSEVYRVKNRMTIRLRAIVDQLIGVYADEM